MGPSIHASLSSLCEFRVNETLCINKVKEAELTLQVRVTSITQLQESIKRLQVELTPQQEASSTLQTQIEGVTAEHNSLKKENEKLEGELGALSDSDFFLENFSSLTNIF